MQDERNEPFAEIGANASSSMSMSLSYSAATVRRQSRRRRASQSFFARRPAHSAADMSQVWETADDVR